MIRHVLVTGAAGFFGRHFCRYLAAHAPEVELTATDIVPPGTETPGRFVQVDLADEAAARELIRAVGPDAVVHLAGTFGSGAAVDLYRANVLSLLALLEAMRQHVPTAIVVAAGSAAEYGRVAPGQLPVTENCPCRPVTAYGQSKLIATQIALYYHRVHALRVMIVRPFQLIGKGVTPRLAPGAFAEQLRQARQIGATTIQVGNLSSSRDFLDVRDAAAAVWTLCSKPAPGEIFNMCSGQPTRIADLLDAMIAITGAQVRVEVDPSRLRGAADAEVVYGSYDRLKLHCGWHPQRSLEESISAMLS